jgi:hypothetical protein
LKNVIWKVSTKQACQPATPASPPQLPVSVSQCVGGKRDATQQRTCFCLAPSPAAKHHSFGIKQEEVPTYNPTKPNINSLLRSSSKLVTLGFVGNSRRLGSPRRSCEGLEVTLSVLRLSELLLHGAGSREEGEPSWSWEILCGIPHTSPT